MPGDRSTLLLLGIMFEVSILVVDLGTGGLTDAFRTFAFLAGALGLVGSTVYVAALVLGFEK